MLWRGSAPTFSRGEGAEGSEATEADVESGRQPTDMVVVSDLLMDNILESLNPVPHPTVSPAFHTRPLRGHPLPGRGYAPAALNNNLP